MAALKVSFAAYADVAGGSPIGDYSDENKAVLKCMDWSPLRPLGPRVAVVARVRCMLPRVEIIGPFRRGITVVDRDAIGSSAMSVYESLMIGGTDLVESEQRDLLVGDREDDIVGVSVYAWGGRNVLFDPKPVRRFWVAGLARGVCVPVSSSVSVKRIAALLRREGIEVRIGNIAGAPLVLPGVTLIGSSEVANVIEYTNARVVVWPPAGVANSWESLGVRTVSAFFNGLDVTMAAVYTARPFDVLDRQPPVGDGYMRMLCKDQIYLEGKIFRAAIDSIVDIRNFTRSNASGHASALTVAWSKNLPLPYEVVILRWRYSQSIKSTGAPRSREEVMALLCEDRALAALDTAVGRVKQTIPFDTDWLMSWPEYGTAAIEDLIGRLLERTSVVTNLWHLTIDRFPDAPKVAVFIPRERFIEQVKLRLEAGWNQTFETVVGWRDDAFEQLTREGVAIVDAFPKLPEVGTLYYAPPGSGKTYWVDHLRNMLIPHSDLDYMAGVLCTFMASPFDGYKLKGLLDMFDMQNAWEEVVRKYWEVLSGLSHHRGAALAELKITLTSA